MHLKLKHKALISLAVIVFILIPVFVSFAENANYIYDSTNRLIRVEYGDGRVVEYAYDDVGNLLQRVTGPKISVSPTSCDFGSINVGSTSPSCTLTVTNTGVTNLVLGTLSITGTNASQFSKQNDNCSSWTVTPSSSCTVNAVFSPTSAGAKNANLSIPSNDPDTPTLNVSLSGTGLSLPIAPTNPAATAVSSYQINLSWTDNSDNEDGFKIERKTEAGGTYAQIATVGANVTTYSDTDLTRNTTYYYRIRAYNAAGDSAFSSETSATTLSGAPTNLTATAVSSSQINFSWQDNTNDETGFKIDRKTGAGGTYVQIATVGANVTTYSDTGLTPNTTYYYRVKAYKTGVYNTASSNETNATTSTAPPAVPTNLTATAVSSSQINLGWTDNSANEDGFKIERKTGAGGTYAQIATVGANVTTFPDAGLTPNTTYYYKVRAYNVSGDSDYSNEASATTSTSLTPPVPPGNLTATAVSSYQINLSWTDNSDNEDGFKIERKTEAGGTYAQIATVGANVTTYSDTDLTRNTTYYYRIRAYNAAGDSAFSSETSATTLSGAPTNLTATAVSSSQINLSWQDNTNDETGFKIDRKTGAGGTYVQIATVGANVTTYSDTGLTPNTTYYYRVKAYKSGVYNTSYSNEASATTLSP